MAKEFRWLNPPARWSGDARRIELVTAEKTDFWRETFYGFIRDSGHAYLRAVAAISPPQWVQGDYEALYDQAGLMLRLDETDLDQGRHRVHRRPDAFQRRRDAGVSDWSVIPLPDADPSDAFRCG